MGTVSTRYKRAFMRALYDQREEQTGASLLRMLKDATKARYESTKAGKVLVSTAANGHSTTWEVPSDLTPTEVFEMIGELRDRYDEAVARTGSETDGTEDAAIYAEMMEKLNRVNYVVSDFRNLRSEPEEATT
jgi:hypothetical protein